MNILNYGLQSDRNYAASEAQSKLFFEKAKGLITVWGGAGHLNDYSSKSCSDMYKGFYWPRWKMFLQTQRDSSIKYKVFDELRVKQSINKRELRCCYSQEM